MMPINHDYMSPVSACSCLTAAPLSTPQLLYDLPTDLHFGNVRHSGKCNFPGRHALS